MYFTYIISCKDSSLYTGYTSDIKRRMKEHERGVNSKYTRAKGFEKLEVYFVSNSKSRAMKLESKIKKFTRLKKLSIIRDPEHFILEIDKDENYSVGDMLTISTKKI